MIRPRSFHVPAFNALHEDKTILLPTIEEVFQLRLGSEIPESELAVLKGNDKVTLERPDGQAIQIQDNPPQGERVNILKNPINRIVLFPNRINSQWWMPVYGDELMVDNENASGFGSFLSLVASKAMQATPGK